MLFVLVLSSVALPHPGAAAEPTAAPGEPLFQRALPEALVPVGRPATAAETLALETALRHYRHGGSREDVAPLTDYLERHPDSPWRIALLTNLGLIYYDTAQFSKALAAFDRAWQAGNGSTRRPGEGIGRSGFGRTGAHACPARS